MTTRDTSITRVPRRIWEGTGLLVLGRLFGSACTLAYLFVLARQLDGAGFGRLTFYLALFMVLDSMVDLGTGHVAIQRTASDPQLVPGVLRAARRIRLAAGLCGVLLVGGGAFLAGEEGALWILVASLYPITHVLELSTLVFKNKIAWGRPVVVRAGAAFASLAFVLVFQAMGVREPTLFLLAIALGSALGNLFLHLVARGHLPRERGEDVPLRPLLAAALPMGIAGLCQQMYFYIDNLFVRALEGQAAVGHYNLAVRFLSYGIMLAVFATLAALPWFTREHKEGRLGPAVARLAQPLFALAGLATGLATPWSADLLALFGEEFRVAASSLNWLLLACLAVYVGAAFLTAVVAMGRTRAVLVIAASGLALNLAGNAWLVPRLGIEGAAIATLATEVLVAVSAAIVLLRAGISVGGAHAWRWILGPALYIIARALSSGLANSL